MSVAEGGRRFRRHFDSDPAVVADVMAALVTQFSEYDLPVEAVCSIEIVLSEVINNINEHAYDGAPDGPVELRAELGPEHVDFMLTDRGAAMPGGQLPTCKQAKISGPVAQLPEGGFGWCLIRDLASDLHYERNNGENRFSFRVLIGGSTAKIG